MLPAAEIPDEIIQRQTQQSDAHLEAVPAAAPGRQQNHHQRIPISVNVSQQHGHKSSHVIQVHSCSSLRPGQGSRSFVLHDFALRVWGVI